MTRPGAQDFSEWAELQTFSDLNNQVRKFLRLKIPPKGGGIVVDRIQECLQTSSNLLDLAGVTFTEQDWKSLTDAIRVGTLRQVTRLNVSGCRLEDRGVKRICRGVETHMYV